MSTPVCIQFGCGTHPLPAPWQNYDMEVDITKPLPFASDSVDFIFAEMVVEHVTPQQGWNFLDECFRLLKPGGVVRIVIPDFVKNMRDLNAAYMAANNRCTGAVTRKEHARSIIFCHGHQAMWTQEMMVCALDAIGFKAVPVKFLESAHPMLNDIEQHWKCHGKDVSVVDSGCAEGTKP